MLFTSVSLHNIVEDIMDWCIVIVSFCLIPLLLALLSKWRYTYWKRRGVKQLEPEFFYGDLREMLTGQISIGAAFQNVYNTFRSQNLRYGGIYLSFKPEFIPVDNKLIKDIMLKSFSHFQDRGSYNHKNDILTQNLFRMDGEPWKKLRVKLSPTFTSSKMRMMFETLCEKTEGLDKVIKQCIADEGGIMNVTDVTQRFTTDVIGSCAFGIECDSLANADCDFRVFGKKINRPNAFKQWMENTFPRKLLGYTGFKSFPELEEFIRDVVSKTIEYREKNEVFRKDFLHLLIQLRNTGVLTDDGKLNKEGKNETGILTDDEIVAQCFIFFAAGFDTSSATMAFSLYELAMNNDIQDKVRQEVREVLKKYDGKLTYEGVKELVYTEKVVSETLRKYPVLPAIPRICTKAYKVPDSNVVLEKGTSVQIPVWGLQMDPEYYPNPEMFDPERFSEKEKAKRPEFTYLPFGEGPRICIGARFGIIQAKIGLASLIKNAKFSVIPKTPKNLSFKPSLVLLHSTEEIWLKVEKV